MEIIKKRCVTTFKKNILDKDFAETLYYTLQYNTEWEEGIRSRKGFTRKAKALDPNDNPILTSIVLETLTKITKQQYVLEGIYLNYYQDGNMWTPNHSHKGTHQLVISLGDTRTLEIGKKKFSMENGDAILFGGSIHGVPKEENKKGRISIATFMSPVN